ncbi:hypothetical protein ACWEFJ_00410 [Actinosynnema sp. NPDC004786]
MSRRIAFQNTSDRRPTPAKKTPPVQVSSTQETRQESTSMSDRASKHQTTPDFTAAHFPTPDLALRGTADEARVRAFAHEQARAARTMLPRVAAALALPSTAHRVRMLTLAYDAVVRWRRALAATAGDARYDAAGRPGADRFAVTLEQGGPNHDRIGEVGRMRAGARWDAGTGRWVGGTDTPASRILAVYGRAALARFAVEAPDSDVLRNPVALPVTGRRMWGNRLLRGEAARHAATRHAARLLARRGTTQVETTGDLLYVVTADSEQRRRALHEAMLVLATAQPGDWSAWWSAAYLLYQAPQFKKGSDATNRVFLAAAGAALLGEAPVIPHDLDLRCMVLGQNAITATPLLCGQVTA